MKRYYSLMQSGDNPNMSWPDVKLPQQTHDSLMVHGCGMVIYGRVKSFRVVHAWMFFGLGRQLAMTFVLYNCCRLPIIGQPRVHTWFLKHVHPVCA